MTVNDAEQDGKFTIMNTRYMYVVCDLHFFITCCSHHCCVDSFRHRYVYLRCIIHEADTAGL